MTLYKIKGDINIKYENINLEINVVTLSQPS